MKNKDAVGLIVTVVYFVCLVALLKGLFSLGLPTWNGQPILAIVIAMPAQLIGPVVALFLLGEIK